MEKIKFILVLSLITLGATKTTSSETIDNGLNRILGKDNLVSGQNNKVHGLNNVIDGFGNTLTANISTVKGNNNELQGLDTTILGQSNIVLSSKSLIQGNSNIVEKDNNFVNGNNNIIRQNVLGPQSVANNNFIVGNLNKHYLIKNSGSNVITATKIGSQNDNSIINIKGISSISSQNMVKNNKIEPNIQTSPLNSKNQIRSSQNNSNSLSSSTSQQSSSQFSHTSHSQTTTSQNITKQSITNRLNTLPQQKTKPNIQSKVSVRTLMSKPSYSIKKLNVQQSSNTFLDNKKSSQQIQKQLNLPKLNVVSSATQLNNVNNILDVIPLRSTLTTKNFSEQSQLKSISSSIDSKNKLTTEQTHYKQSDLSQRKIPNIKLSQIANQSNLAINSFVQKTNQLIKTTIPTFINQTHNSIRKQTEGLKRKFTTTKNQFKKSIKQQKQQWKKAHKNYRKGGSRSRKQRQYYLSDQQLHQQHAEFPIQTHQYLSVPVEVPISQGSTTYNSVCRCGCHSQNCNCYQNYVC